MTWNWQKKFCQQHFLDFGYQFSDWGSCSWTSFLELIPSELWSACIEVLVVYFSSGPLIVICWSTRGWCGTWGWGSRWVRFVQSCCHWLSLFSFGSWGRRSEWWVWWTGRSWTTGVSSWRWGRSWWLYRWHCGSCRSLGWRWSSWSCQRWSQWLQPWNRSPVVLKFSLSLSLQSEIYRCLQFRILSTNLAP